MTHDVVYDIAGVGIDPFNLGLAALASPTGLRTIFFDPSPGIAFPPSAMPSVSDLQLPFLYDLVTPADPASQFTYLKYLESNGKLHLSGIAGNLKIVQKEYIRYCHWVSAQVTGMMFGHEVLATDYDENRKCYIVETTSHSGKMRILAKHLVLSGKLVPRWPGCTGEIDMAGVIHSSAYMANREMILKAGGCVAVVGPGQQAAEIYYDLLLHGKWKISRLEWLTPAAAIGAAHLTGFSLEMAAQEYYDYFHSLPPNQQLSIQQKTAVSGGSITLSLLDAIYNELHYNIGDCPITMIATNSVLTGISTSEKGFTISLLHKEKGANYCRHADHVILATGYKNVLPDGLAGIGGRLRELPQGGYHVAANYAIDTTGTQIFMQHTINPDNNFHLTGLMSGPHRNAVIINSILGNGQYKTTKGGTFQTFGIPY